MRTLPLGHFKIKLTQDRHAFELEECGVIGVAYFGLVLRKVRHQEVDLPVLVSLL